MKKLITEKELVEQLEKETAEIFESFFGFKADDDLDMVIEKLTKNKG